MTQGPNGLALPRVSCGRIPRLAGRRGEWVMLRNPILLGDASDLLQRWKLSLTLG